jgi:hypothetical protein
MPSTSKKQHNFMAAVAHSPSFAKKAGVPQSVGKDFSNADKGKTFKQGGDMASKMNPGFMAMMAKKKGAAQEGSKKDMMADKAQMMGMKKGGAAKKMAGGGMAYAKGGSASSRADGIAQKGKTKGKLLNKGGMAC